MLPPSRCTPDRRRPTTNPREGAKQQTTVAPLLSVRHGAQAIEFYKAAFGAQELLRIEDQGGAVVARLAVGESEFWLADEDRKSTRLNSSHPSISYAVFCLKKKK